MDLKALMNIQVKEVEGEERILRFTASTDVKDRDGEIIDAGAFKLKNFRKNPVFLLAHDYRDLPIGKVINITQENGKLEHDVKFPTREDYAIADTVYRLYKGGFMHAVSVGFRPNRDKIDIIDGVRHYKEVELLEISAVSVPANPEAVMQRMFEAQGKGLVNEQEIIELTLAAKSFFKGMKKADTPAEIKTGRVLSKANEKLLRDAIESVGKATETISKVLDKVTVQEPEEPKTAKKYPSFKRIYNTLLSKKAGSKAGNVGLIDPTLIDGMKGLKKE